jgi:hypothetical protein
MFSTRPVRQLRDATIEAQLEQCYLCGPCRDVTSGQFSSVELMQRSKVSYGSGVELSCESTDVR